MSYAPYAPPASPPSPSANAFYRPFGAKTAITVVAIVATMILGVGLATYAVFAAVSPPSQNGLVAAVVGGLSLVLQIANIAAGIAFLVWMHHASTNAHSFGHEGLRYEPAWAVAWWFIPIVSMWKPFGAMREIWRASDPRLASMGSKTAWAGIEAPALLLVWWLTYLASGTIAVVGGLGAGYAAAMGRDVTTGNVLVAISQVLSIVAGIAVIVILRRIDRHQAELQASLASAGAR